MPSHHAPVHAYQPLHKQVYVNSDDQCCLCMLQVETSEVHIPDFDYDTISWMLRYMYGCLELTPQHLTHARVRP